MSLTPPEELKFREIERRLSSHDPAFARRMTAQARPVSRRVQQLVAAPESRPDRVLLWLLAGLACYIVLGTAVVLGFAGSVGAGTIRLLLAVDVIVPFVVLAAARHLRRTRRSPQTGGPAAHSRLPRV